MTNSHPTYSKTHPFLASIKERYSLCKKGSQKSTVHVVLDLKDSGLTYEVGDSIAVFGQHDPELVQKTLKALGATGSELIVDKHSEQSYTLTDYLTSHGNITDISRKFITELGNRQTNPLKKERLQKLIAEEEKEALKEYQHNHEVWDALEENLECVFSPQELCNLLQPLLPRFYSIASSMKAVKEEVHLTVAELVYETNNHTRRGVCTHYLCQLAPMNTPVIPVYIHPANNFTLPEDPNASIIMVGPGTGIAPFRAFMQERNLLPSQGKNWLFFGEWHRDFEFFYENEWEKFEKEGKLRLDTAFSRDQKHKIYVQHRLLEHGAELFSLLEEGAYFFVCGDARRMAKDVDLALHQIVQTHGHFDETETKQYIKKLKTEKRYLRDVY